MKSNILIVDDDLDTLDSLSDLLSEKGYLPHKARGLKGAQDMIDNQAIDAVLLDIYLSDGNGLDWIISLREQLPHVAIIVITGVGDIPDAVEAMRRGADNFLTKPINSDQMILFLSRSIEIKRLRRQDSLNKRFTSDKSIFKGESPLMRNVWQLAETAAENDSAVLLMGQTGTGKGIFARWIHDSGARKKEPYVEVNCSSLKGELLASELFGHRKGAFTSAIEDREGLIEAANGGTLFLDEIGDMDLSVQAQFLKVIEEKSFRRVGESKLRHSKFRLICATNKNLVKEAESNNFRQDLYFRICIFPIEIPPLKQYAEDLGGIFNNVLSTLGCKEAYITPEAIRLLEAYSWPGNIRELKNVLERASLLSRGAPIEAQHLSGLGGTATIKNNSIPSDWNMKKNEVMHINKAFEYFNGDVAKTAKALGISRATFYRKLKK